MTKLDEIMGYTLYPENSIPESIGFIQEDLKSGKRIYSISDIRNVALEFAKHILEEAAENITVKFSDTDLGYILEECEFPINQKYVFIELNKQSITDTLNKYL